MDGELWEKGSSEWCWTEVHPALISHIQDFHGLEKECRYDGYTKTSETIKSFWEIVHTMTEDERKRLLKFCTGSDRVPIKGLGSMLFVVARNGDDSDMYVCVTTCHGMHVPQFVCFRCLCACAAHTPPRLAARTQAEILETVQQRKPLVNTRRCVPH